MAYYIATEKCWCKYDNLPPLGSLWKGLKGSLYHEILYRIDHDAEDHELYLTKLGPSRPDGPYDHGPDEVLICNRHSLRAIHEIIVDFYNTFIPYIVDEV